MVQKSDVYNILKVPGNPPYANLEIQDGFQNDRHYLVFIISWQPDMLQMQIKCLNIGLHTVNVIYNYYDLKNISKKLT